MGIESLSPSQPACALQARASESRADSGAFLRPVAECLSAISAADCIGVREDRRLPIESEWVSFLTRYEWQWFATFTFRDDVHPEAADKRFRLWAKLLDEAQGCSKRVPKDSPRRITWARGLEWQKRGVLHFHALVGNIKAWSNTRAWRDVWATTWNSFEGKVRGNGGGGFARIDACDNAAAVLGYIAKYCAKGGEVDLSANLEGKQLVAGSVSAGTLG